MAAAAAACSIRIIKYKKALLFAKNKRGKKYKLS
jgi:hypothetical protein